MNWRYPESETWETLTVKRLEDGQWVPIGGGGGGGDDGDLDPKFPTGEPPTRGTTESVQDDYGGDLQAALEGIDPDTRLTLDGATYTGTWNWPTTDEITVDGQGATVEHAGSADRTFDMSRTGDEFDTNTPATETYAEGQQRLGVSDPSIFDVGDVARVYDPDDVYRVGDARSSSGTIEGLGQYTVVTDVDSGAGEIEVDDPLVHPFSDPEGNLRVDNVEFRAVDQRVTDLTFDGTSASAPSDSMRWYRSRYVWMDDCTIRNYDGNEDADAVTVYECYQARLDGLEMQDCARYGTNSSSGTAYTYVTDCTALNETGRYAYKFGSGGRWLPALHYRLENCEAYGSRGFATEVHDGGEDAEHYDVYAENTGYHKSRGKDAHVEGYEVQGPHGTSLARATQYPEDVTYRQIWYHGSGDWDTYGFQFHDKDHTDLPLLDHRFEDVWWDDPDGDLTPFRFRTDNGSQEIDGLEIVNVAHGDEWVDHSYFENTTSWAPDRDSWTITDLTIETPDARTPSEYFADEHGWTPDER